MPEPVRFETAGTVGRVILNRPEVRNAFNGEVIARLSDIFQTIRHDGLRVIVLQGEGEIFCAGMDIKWLGDSMANTEGENYLEAKEMAEMFRLINECPLPLIGRIHGGAFGGGSGLASVCDIVVASDDCRFSFGEVRLGIIPAVISPYAISKIGETNARRYFLTGEVFSAQRAKEIGLVHEVVPAGAVDSEVQKIVETFSRCGPEAVKEAKKLIRDIRKVPYDDLPAFTAGRIAHIRTTEEAKEGVRAFIEKRPPKFP